MEFLEKASGCFERAANNFNAYVSTSRPDPITRSAVTGRGEKK